MWPFKIKTVTVSQKSELEDNMNHLKKAHDLLDQRFAAKQISNDAYLKKATDLNKQMEKCQKKLDKIAELEAEQSQE